MATSTFFPLLNASLNAASALLLLIGYGLIKNGKTDWHKAWHKRVMTSALGVSAVFLFCYLYYHYNYAAQKFSGEGAVRVLYFFILLSHILLAVIILPFILRVFMLAFQQEFSRHSRLAKWIWPLWMYTSVTGVLVYLFLYQWFPSNAGALTP